MLLRCSHHIDRSSYCLFVLCVLSCFVQNFASNQPDFMTKLNADEERGPGAPMQPMGSHPAAMDLQAESIDPGSPRVECVFYAAVCSAVSQTLWGRLP